jgi:hypothetical protein
MVLQGTAVVPQLDDVFPPGATVTNTAFAAGTSVAQPSGTGASIETSGKS